jgi:hypothetical protein
MQQKQSHGALSTTTDDTEVPRALAGSVAPLIGSAFSVNFIPKAFQQQGLDTSTPSGRATYQMVASLPSSNAP